MAIKYIKIRRNPGPKNVQSARIANFLRKDRMKRRVTNFCHVRNIIAKPGQGKGALSVLLANPKHRTMIRLSTSAGHARARNSWLKRIKEYMIF